MIGTVSSAIQNEDASNQTLNVELAADPSDLRFVSVVLVEPGIGEGALTNKEDEAIANEITADEVNADEVNTAEEPAVDGEAEAGVLGVSVDDATNEAGNDAAVGSEEEEGQ